MTKGQKWILLVLALVNVLVIGGMATYVIIQSRAAIVAPTPPPLTATDADVDLLTASACSEYILESLRPLEGTVRVSTLDRALFVEISFDQRSVAPTISPEESPQSLWALFDSLPPDLARICGTPDWVTLSARFGGSTPVRIYTAQVAGEHFTAWLVGTLDDEGLASEARYRSSVD